MKAKHFHTPGACALTGRTNALSSPLRGTENAKNCLLNMPMMNDTMLITH